MNNHDLEALIASLRDGARRGLAPREMMPLVDALGLPAQLVWEREAYDDRYHYDALIPTGDGTLSISFAPDGALPWPLRGVRRWSDGDLVRVNETLLRVLEAIRLFDFVWAQAPLTTALVNACLIHEAVAAERIEPTDEQLQSAFDAFRARRGLLTEADTAAWMESRGYSLEQLERAMVDEARVEALRDRVTDAHLDGFLATRLQELDLALFAQLDLSSRDDAARLAEDLRTGHADFFALAARRAGALQMGSRPNELPLTRSILRGDRDEPHRRHIFAAQPGDIVGPLPLAQGARVVRVLAFSPASLDGDARARARAVLFSEWLAERRRTARIEWQWGVD